MCVNLFQCFVLTASQTRKTLTVASHIARFAQIVEELERLESSLRIHDENWPAKSMFSEVVYLIAKGLDCKALSSDELDKLEQKLKSCEKRNLISYDGERYKHLRSLLSQIQRLGTP
jgi:hypothetical protein